MVYKNEWSLSFFFREFLLFWVLFEVRIGDFRYSSSSPWSDSDVVGQVTCLFIIGIKPDQRVVTPFIQLSLPISPSILICFQSCIGDLGLLLPNLLVACTVPSMMLRLFWKLCKHGCYDALHITPVLPAIACVDIKSSLERHRIFIH